MEERYYERMAAAYLRGVAAAKDITVPEKTAALFAGKWEEMTGEDVKKLLLAGQSLGIRLHYFKRSSGELPRVKRTLGILRGLSFQSLLDVGSGRGVFLIPFLEASPGDPNAFSGSSPRRRNFCRPCPQGEFPILPPFRAISAKKKFRKMPLTSLLFWRCLSISQTQNWP